MMHVAYQTGRISEPMMLQIKLKLSPVRAWYFSTRMLLVLVLDNWRSQTLYVSTQRKQVCLWCTGRIAEVLSLRSLSLPVLLIWLFSPLSRSRCWKGKRPFLRVYHLQWIRLWLTYVAKLFPLWLIYLAKLNLPC